MERRFRPGKLSPCDDQGMPLAFLIPLERERGGFKGDPLNFFLAFRFSVWQLYLLVKMKG